MARRERKSSLRVLLSDRPARGLRLVLESIVRMYSDEEGRSDQARVRIALHALMGKKVPRGPAPQNRDLLLEMVAFEYSGYIKNTSNPPSIETVARNWIEFLDIPIHSGDSAVSDVVRKFSSEKEALISKYGLGGSEGFDDFYNPVWAAIGAIKTLGIKVDASVVPPEGRQET